MKKKTLFVSDATLYSGGAERVLSVLSSHFADEYERVVYILWLHYPIFYEIDDRVEIVDIEERSGKKNILQKMWWFRQYVIKEKPDLILSFLYPWSMKVITSLLLTSYKIVVAERQDPRIVFGGALGGYLRKCLYKKAKGIVVQTDSNSKYYQGDVKVIYNPISISEEKRGCAIRAKKEKTIVSVGRLIPQKNRELLIKAFARFYKSHPDYSLIIYGDGHLKESLHRLAESYHIANVVKMPGNSSNVIESISNATAFVLSSNYEGMPNALIEAMCIGLPCISTKVSGATDLIESGKNGLLVELNDVEAMARAMSFIVEHDSEREKMSIEATNIFDLLNQDMICRKWIDYINLKMSE